MPMYLTRFSYTPETWARLIQKPEDRRAAAQQYIESVGGKLHGFWYAFGDHDAYNLWEAPDNVSMAAVAVAIGAGGALSSLQTTVLLTVDETLEALEKAQSIKYKAARQLGSQIRPGPRLYVTAARWPGARPARSRSPIGSSGGCRCVPPQCDVVIAEGDRRRVTCSTEPRPASRRPAGASTRAGRAHRRSAESPIRPSSAIAPRPASTS